MRRHSFFGLTLLALFSTACSGGVAPVEVLGPGPGGDSKSPSPGDGAGAVTGNGNGSSGGTDGASSGAGSGSGSGASSASSSSSSSSASSSSGDMCIHCVNTLIGAPTTLCDGSQTMYDDLQTCACGDTCPDCADDFCAGAKPATACLSCMATNCQSEYQACAMDSM